MDWSAFYTPFFPLSVCLSACLQPSIVYNPSCPMRRVFILFYSSSFYHISHLCPQLPPTKTITVLTDGTRHVYLLDRICVCIPFSAFSPRQDKCSQPVNLMIYTVYCMEQILQLQVMNGLLASLVVFGRSSGTRSFLYLESFGLQCTSHTHRLTSRARLAD